MTENEIKSSLRMINEFAFMHDYEHAHDEEDSLYEEFVKHVAEDGEGELKQMAELVLTSRKIQFPRWKS